jgi:ADP-ribosylglycohydrolase
VRFLDAPFADLQQFVASLRGDVDTIGAMAGAVWGAANGAHRLPAAALGGLEQHERIEAAAAALHARRYGVPG